MSAVGASGEHYSRCWYIILSPTDCLLCRWCLTQFALWINNIIFAAAAAATHRQTPPQKPKKEKKKKKRELLCLSSYSKTSWSSHFFKVKRSLLDSRIRGKIFAMKITLRVPVEGLLVESFLSFLILVGRRQSSNLGLVNLSCHTIEAKAWHFHFSRAEVTPSSPKELSRRFVLSPWVL